jgi:3-oxoacyl-[acyl-carrier-protein] synthase-3
MYIAQTAHYVPILKINNAHFEKLTGLTDDWIVSRTGMKERSRAAVGENTNTMAVDAVKVLEAKVDLSRVDLIVAGSYTFYDNIVTPAHEIQHYLKIEAIPTVSITTACSSFLNAMEIVEGYFAMKKASTALVVLTEHNSLYHNETDPKSGHLWGDGAAALLVTKDKTHDNSLAVKQIITGGAANVGKGTEGVMLKPAFGGIDMPHGKDVFINACTYMAQLTLDILESNGYTIKDLSYLVPHQANYRIALNIMQTLGIDSNKALSNVQYLGNTGSAGSAIALSEHWDSYQESDILVVSVFGGGYSYGAMLLEKL